MKEIFFFRNIENYNELLSKDQMKRGISKNNQNFKIIKTIFLEKNKYEDFLKCFNRTWDFLYEYIDQMKIENNVWKCILVKSEGDEGILIMSDGYQYPRFTALFFDANSSR